MLSKNKIKFIKSLQQKKFRTMNNLFVVEGRKGVLSLIGSSFTVEEVYCSTNIFSEYPEINTLNPIVVEESVLENASALMTNREAIAVVHQKESPNIDWEREILFLDGISDPGNLGTIIRTAEWFGIHQVICSFDAVEFYNPKVIQSTMGAFAHRIPVVLSVEEFIRQKPHDVPVFIADLAGEAPEQLAGLSKGVLVMGSESHGVSTSWGDNVQRICIPSSVESKAESLNVAIATSILCYQIKNG